MQLLYKKVSSIVNYSELLSEAFGLSCFMFIVRMTVILDTTALLICLKKNSVGFD